MQLTDEDRTRQLAKIGQGAPLHTLAAANGCCVGAVLSGTVLTNFLTQDLSRPGLNQGRPLLGQVHVGNCLHMRELVLLSYAKRLC
jgi:hypothetical protein